MKKTRSLILTSSILLLMSAILFSACEADTVTNESFTNAVGTDSKSDVQTETERADFKDSLPDDLDFKGETINIVYQSELFDDLFYEDYADIVASAINNRNSMVSERLNVTINFIVSSAPWPEYKSFISKSILANSTDYDILHLFQYDFVPLSIENYFSKLNDAPYLDFDMPWWATDYIREMSVDGESLYFLLGDINKSMIRSMSCMYFNKNLYASVMGDAENLYETVLEGKWTLDSFAQQAKLFYSDLNGNGVKDMDDQIGYGIITGNMTDHLLFDADNHMTTRDQNGYPIVNPANERLLDTVDIIIDLEWNNEGGCQFPSSEDGLQQIINSFSSSNAVMKLGWFSDADKLRDMEDDYGIIPFPKYNEAQENYLSLVHDATTMFALPVNCIKYEASCALLEALAAESYRSLTPAYYETALKIKYSRDDVSSEIVDLIHSHPTTDFAYIFNYGLNSVGIITREMAVKRENTVASWFEANRNKIEKTLSDYIEAIE